MKELGQLPEGLISRDKAISLLEPIFDDLTVSIREGLLTYRDIPPGIRLKMTERSKSCSMNDFVVEGATPSLTAAGYELNDDYNGVFFIRPADNVALRFKKVKGLVPKNVRTKRQVDISLQKEIPGFPAVTYLTVGYQVDPAWVSINRVDVILTLDERPRWRIPIAETVETRPLIRDESEDQLIRRARVRSKLLNVEAKGG